MFNTCVRLITLQASALSLHPSPSYTYSYTYTRILIYIPSLGVSKDRQSCHPNASVPCLLASLVALSIVPKECM